MFYQYLPPENVKIIKCICGFLVVVAVVVFVCLLVCLLLFVCCFVASNLGSDRSHVCSLFANEEHKKTGS